jgi:hypothetical protein
MISGVTEANLDEYNRFSDLRNSVDNGKAKTFIEEITGKVVLPQFVIAKWTKVLKDFVLHADMREKILKAWLNEDVTLETATVDEVDVDDVLEEMEHQGQAQQATEVPHINKIKNEIIELITLNLSALSPYMRPMPEIVDAMVYVIDKETNKESFGDVGVMLNRALTNIYKENATFVDKRVAFHILTTQYETYLKKLYYLVKGEEVKPEVAGGDVTWKNVIYGLHRLWDLKYSPNLTKKKLSDWLENVKGWRNNEAHGSYTISEQDLDKNIKIVLTMYCYAAGAYIIELKSTGLVTGGPTIVNMAADREP